MPEEPEEDARLRKEQKKPNGSGGTPWLTIQRGHREELGQPALHPFREAWARRAIPSREDRPVAHGRRLSREAEPRRGAGEDGERGGLNSGADGI
jgi:hypothetical protein